MRSNLQLTMKPFCKAVSGGVPLPELHYYELTHRGTYKNLMNINCYHTSYHAHYTSSMQYVYISKYIISDHQHCWARESGGSKSLPYWKRQPVILETSASAVSRTILHKLNYSFSTNESE